MVGDTGSERISDLSTATQLGEEFSHISNPGQADVKDTALKFLVLYPWSFPGGSAGKESACNAGHPGSIPGSRGSTGEGIGTHSSMHGLPW